ncbi:MAG: hypothetical protein SGJ17_09015 [Hyphomicrobiales bacterium]|nr:hypothetical protein [Hyphomicrobiales bacterium]
MTIFYEVASLVWSYQFSLVPVLVTYLIFETPALIRRLTKIAYVPLYFIFFPSGHSDSLYAQYFNEDHFYPEGASMSDAQKIALRHRIQATAIFSMIFACILAPWICGFFSAFYLTKSQFIEFLIFWILMKFALLTWVLIELRNDSEVSRKSFGLILLFYLFYFILVILGLTKSFDWTYTNLDSKGFIGLIGALVEYAYLDIFINIIVVSAVTWGVTKVFTNPSNILEPSEVYEDETHINAD